MRKCKCSQCGKEFHENDSGPGVHYSSPATICHQCEVWNRTPVGGYIQIGRGEYVQKTANN